MTKQSEVNWAPIFRWVLFLGGLGSSWWTMASGEMPYSMWLGIAAIILAGGLGLNLAITGIGLALFFLRYAMFLTPLVMHFGQPWWVYVPLTLGFAIWESAPLWVAGVVGVWTLRRRSIPGWAVFALVVGIHLSLAVWMPRPYYFSWGAPLVARFPAGVWMFGVDLFAALTLGWVCLIVRAATIGNRSLYASISIAAAPLAALLLCMAFYENWVGTAQTAEKETHNVITIQGALPPFSGGFAVTSDRLLTPVVLYSALQPDLLLFPECITQAAGGLDENEPLAVSKRHFGSITTAIAAPYSQVAFGMRDWNTNRIYFTDIADGKPDVFWKDVEYRTPFVDQWPKRLTPLVSNFGFRNSEQIVPAEKTRGMGLYVRDAKATNGLRLVGRSLILMSGEIRRPLIVQKARADKKALVAMNPNIGGWMGAQELRGSVLQANARALELGMILYRAGQLGATGIFVPWQESAAEDAVAYFGPGMARYRARLPKGDRYATGFTTVFWISLYLGPWIVGLTLVWLLTPAGLKERLLSLPSSGTRTPELQVEGGHA